MENNHMLRPCWRSFLNGGGIDIVKTFHADKCSQYFDYSLMLFHRTMIIKDARTRIVDTVKMLILGSSYDVFTGIVNCKGGQYRDHTLYQPNHLYSIWLARPKIVYQLPTVTGSNGSIPLERCGVRVGTGTELLQRVLPHDNPHRCNWAGFTTNNPVFQHHNFVSNQVFQF